MLLRESKAGQKDGVCVCVCVGVERSPHRSLGTIGGKPGREAPIISAQRTVVSVSRFKPS